MNEELYYIKLKGFPYGLLPFPTKVVHVMYVDYAESLNAEPLTYHLFRQRNIRFGYREFRHKCHENLVIVFAKIEAKRFDEATIILNNIPAKTKVLYGEDVWKSFNTEAIHVLGTLTKEEHIRRGL